MKLFSRHNRAATAAKPVSRPVSLACEQLDARLVPTVNLPGPPPTIDQTLYINGTSQNDTITVDPMPWGMLRIRITTKNEDGDIISSSDRTIRQLGVIRINIDAGDGDDKVYNNTALPSTILGGAGNDILSGGWASDVLRGGTNSSDYLDETFDRNELYNDYLYGWGGDDWLYGEDGADQLFGGNGNDHLYGGAAQDFLMGDGYDDWLYGDAGNDQLFGGEGADHMEGGIDSDLLQGDGGADYLSGDDGNDTLMGWGDGVQDEIWTGPGYDQVVPDWHQNGLVKALDDLVQDFDLKKDSFVFAN